MNGSHSGHLTNSLMPFSGAQSSKPLFLPVALQTVYEPTFTVLSDDFASSIKSRVQRSACHGREYCAAPFLWIQTYRCRSLPRFTFLHFSICFRVTHIFFPPYS